MKASVPLNRTGVLEIPGINERRQVHLLNPASGNRRYYEAACRAIDKQNGDRLVSEKPGHLRSLTAELFSKEPFAHAIVYGGDGSVNEVINGIMDSGCSATASFSVIPAGSGNDFSSYANDSAGFKKADLNKIDLIKTVCGGKTRYYANMMNIGFDCSVVRETYTLKKLPLLQGSAAYIAGVLKVLAVKKTIPVKIKLSGCVSLADGSALPDCAEEKRILLTACANSHYCGGGFNAASLASVTDGYMDFITVNDISRLKFISLVGDYKSGEYIDKSGKIKENFLPVISYRRCRKAEITGADSFCLDGEIYDTDAEKHISAEICPKAVWFAAL